MARQSSDLNIFENVSSVLDLLSPSCYLNLNMENLGDKWLVIALLFGRKRNISPHYITRAHIAAET